MFKQTYSTPSVRIVEICTDSAFLTLSNTTKNPFYLLDYAGVDNEFDNNEFSKL